MSRAAAEVGSTANNYQILAKLATGGMAEIFLARGEGVAGVERYCVLKRILRERAGDEEFVQMFLDEARLAAQLHHPNIAQVYDIGKLGDSYFFTMEYVHGETVRALLHRAQGLQRTLPIHGVLTIVAGAAAGLHHAHVRVGLDGRALGIVHRDVSPSNLMVSYEGGVKVVDFGVAKAADRSQETKSGTVKGKIGYLSPEQCRGKRVDRRSDVFSLGICFWEMLTTERLYRRASDFENMNAIVTERTPRPSSRRPEVPPEVDELVLRMLAKNPGDRFQTADEVVEAVEAVAAQTGSVLSSSVLGRFVRELFGQRPEPWIELENQPDSSEGVSVSSEPIPRELAISSGEHMDRQLASVVDLSAVRPVTESLRPPPAARSPVEPGPAEPAPLGPPPLEPPPVEVSTTPLGKRAKLARRGLPLAPPPPTQPGFPVPSVSDSDLSPADRSPGPHATPSGPLAALSAPPESAPHTAATRRTAWPLYAVIAAAVLMGSIGVMVVMRSVAAGETGDAAGASMAAGSRAGSADPIDLAPGGSRRAWPGAGKPAAGPGVVAGADPRADNPIRPVQPPQPVQPGPTRTAAPPSSAPIAPVRPAIPRGPRELRSTETDDLARLYRAGLYDRVVAQCAGPVSAERAGTCLLAACQTHNEAAARRLLTSVPAAQRDALTASCKQLGLDVEQSDCEADPMACQH